ncbi:MAG TPA: hypothetical protein VFH37_00990 [Candidatus Saccharimonadales bacterium]|nr:hypothetical protein [Candidatus Saccharimonadales bacterium]
MARKQSYLRRKKTFSGAQVLLFTLAFAAVGAVAIWQSFAAPANGGPSHSSSSSCSISPNQVVLDQIWTVSALGLPSSGVNQIITFPDGAQSTGPITVSSNGTYTTTGNSNMSATWGFIAPEQKGTYNYQYVGKIKWPAGSFTKLYASCNVTVQ